MSKGPRENLSGFARLLKLSGALSMVSGFVILLEFSNAGKCLKVKFHL